MNQTRRVYRFTETVPLARSALRRRTPEALRAVLAAVWKRYGRGPVPDLTLAPAGETSYAHFYWDGTMEIELAPHHRCFYILLHEIAHCLHTRERAEHGPRFMATYIKLMGEYAHESEEELLITAGLYGIKVHGFSHY